MNIVGRNQASGSAGKKEVMPDQDMTPPLQHATDHRETSETYRGELARWGRFRVAVCKDGLQWLYQRQRRRFVGGGAKWDTLGYCTTRKALMRLHREHTGAEAGFLLCLPAHFARRGQS